MTFKLKPHIKDLVIGICNCNPELRWVQHKNDCQKCSEDVLKNAIKDAIKPIGECLYPWIYGGSVCVIDGDPTCLTKADWPQEKWCWVCDLKKELQ